jgi:hypothetical protein
MRYLAGGIYFFSLRRKGGGIYFFSALRMMIILFLRKKRKVQLRFAKLRKRIAEGTVVWECEQS